MNKLRSTKIVIGQWLRPMLSLVVLSALVLSSTGKVQGEAPKQNSELAPVRVIAVTPAQREVVAPEQTTTIAFDQPMDRASVEAGVSISPQVDVKLGWTNDTTLTVTPSTPLTRGQEYTISIASSAKSQSNAPLEDTFRLTFLVAANLGVSQVVPAPDAQNVEAGASITVVFNRPVVPLINSADQSSLPQPITISPEVEGKGEWVGTSIYTFKPTKAFAGGTNYTVTVNSDLKDVDGTSMGNPYTWKFSTIAPQLQYINPSTGSQLVTLDTAVTVTFNQPMDPASTKEAFSVRNASNGAPVSGTITFSDDQMTLTFQPTSRFQLATNYQITVGAGAKSASGTATLSNPTVATFTTVPYPAIVSYFPQDGQKVEPGQGISVQYNTYMDPKSFVGKVTVEPKPEDLSVNPSGTNLYIGFQSKPATTYTVKIASGVADVYGNVIDQPLEFTFTTFDALPGFGLATRDWIALTSAYQPDTQILAAAINVSRLDAKLSALELPEFLSAVTSNFYNYVPPRITRDWVQPVESKPNERSVFPLKLASDNGGKLSPGIYLLDVTSQEFVDSGTPSSKTVVVVATAALTLKMGPNETLVWVTDLKTGQPIKNAEVTLYSYANKLISGTTNEQGLFQTDQVKLDYQNQSYIYAVATGDGVFGMASPYWYDQTFQPYNYKVQTDNYPRKDVVYLYTDQPVYRPGHPVYFRGVVRNQDDVKFTVPADQKVNVVINDPQGQQVFQQEMTLNSFAAFSGKYEPPANAPLGPYSVQVTYGSYPSSFYYNFQVAEFRPPEFLVNAKADKSEVVAGDTIKVNVDSQFYFGGAVSGAKVTWVAVANTAYFNYTGEGNYDFSAGYFYSDSYIYNRQVGQGEGTLDDKGQFSIELPADLGGSTSPQNFTIEATVTDVSNQAISGRTTVLVHPAKLYIGLAPEKYVGQATEPMNVKIMAVDWQSQPLANQNITLKVIEKRWQQDPSTFEWSQKDIPVTDDKVTTDDKGKAVYTFTPPRAGIYEVEATARDDAERIARTTTNVWVSGPDYVSWGRDANTLNLVLDKKQYAPGDTASILIPSPFAEPVQALVTVERAGIMKTDVVTITGSYTYKLPLEVIHAPNVYVAVTIMRGSGEITPDTKITPETRYGIINIPVSVPQQLKVEITPSTKTAKPGDKVTLEVKTTDLTGEPVSAEVGLALSDLANLSVGVDSSGNIFDAFWSPRGLSIMTYSSLSRLIDDLTEKDIRMMTAYRRERAQTDGSTMTALPTQTANGQLAASGGGVNAPAAAESGAVSDNVAKSGRMAADGKDKEEQAPTPRTNFVDTPLWKPDLVTGQDGRGTADVTLPDNLTTWRLNARAISQNTYVGDTTLDIISTKPLLVRPSTPRFFVVGDEAELAVVVNNNTDQDLSVDVALDAKGVTLKADGKQTVKVAKGDRTRITWLAVVQDVDNVDLAFSAVSGEFSDASKPAVGLGDQRLLPVYDYVAPDYVSTAGTLTRPGTRTEAVIVPNAELAPSGELTIKVQPSLAATTLDGLDYLRNYPYQCIEQTVSKFLPNVITFRALQKLQLDKPELRANLDNALQYAIARLKREQHPDGGWGWFYYDESNALTTAYALLGLVEAKQSDLAIDNDMFQRAVSYLMSTLTQADDNTSAWQLNRMAFAQYVLIRAGMPNVSLLDSIFQRREKMNLYARAFLAQAYFYAQGDRAKIDTLMSDIQTRAIASATGTHWEEDWMDWWNWSSNTRSTAIVLETLTKITPQSELIPNIVRWLMVARKGDVWESTQETAWAVMALTDWMDVSGELKANYAYTVSLNDKAIGDGKANADTLRDTKTLVISVQDMLREQANKIVFDHGEGEGNLYYTATLHVLQPVDLIKPTNRGIGLTRTYYLNNKAVTEAKVGDVITVALEIVAESDLYYVNINDPIPAGTELVDQSLQTTSQVGQPPELTMIDPYYRGWGWWWFSNTELRTEKMVLSASYLPRGTYRFVYQIRASSPGKYKVIPSNGNEFYFPEVFGRGAGSLFTVTP